MAEAVRRNRDDGRDSAAKARLPTPRNSARYCSARTSQIAVASVASVVGAAIGPEAAPMAKPIVPLTGWPSSEVTRHENR